MMLNYYIASPHGFWISQERARKNRIKDLWKGKEKKKEKIAMIQAKF